MKSCYLNPESRVHALCFDEAEAAGDDVVDGCIIRWSATAFRFVSFKEFRPSLNDVEICIELQLTN